MKKPGDMCNLRKSEEYESSNMNHLDYSIHAAEKDILGRLPGSKFVSYHSDMEIPERSYSVVILRVGNMDR